MPYRSCSGSLVFGLANATIDRQRHANHDTVQGSSSRCCFLFLCLPVGGFSIRWARAKPKLALQTSGLGRQAHLIGRSLYSAFHLVSLFYSQSHLMSQHWLYQLMADRTNSSRWCQYRPLRHLLFHPFKTVSQHCLPMVKSRIGLPQRHKCRLYISCYLLVSSLRALTRA